MKSTSFKVALIATLGLRLTCSLFMALFSYLLPRPDCVDFLCSQNIQQTLYEKSAFSNYFLAPWYRWDSVQYLQISEMGYQTENKDDSVWPPLYPLLIRALSGIMSPMLSALLISTLAFFMAMFFLHQNICHIWDKNLANYTIFIFSIFPSSYFFMAAYSESLFLFLSLGCLLSARRRNWVPAGLYGVLAAMTRQLGIFLILPFLWEIYEAYLKEKPINWKKVPLPVFFATLIPLQTGINFGYIHFILKMPWPWETVTRVWSHRLTFPWTGFIGNVRYLLTAPSSMIDISIIFDLVFAIIFVALLAVKIPKMPLSYRIYGACILLPVLVYLRRYGTFTSLNRYVLPIFPVFISIAYFLKNKTLKLSWLAFSLCGQFLLLICFYKWIWTA